MTYDLVFTHPEFFNNRKQKELHLIENPSFKTNCYKTRSLPALSGERFYKTLKMLYFKIASRIKWVDLKFILLRLIIRNEINICIAGMENRLFYKNVVIYRKCLVSFFTLIAAHDKIVCKGLFDRTL